MDKKIFSGVQPTGNLHLGNYLGALKNFVELKQKFLDFTTQNGPYSNKCQFCKKHFQRIYSKFEFKSPIEVNRHSFESSL